VPKLIRAKSGISWLFQRLPNSHRPKIGHKDRCQKPARGWIREGQTVIGDHEAATLLARHHGLENLPRRDTCRATSPDGPPLPPVVPTPRTLGTAPEDSRAYEGRVSFHLIAAWDSTAPKFLARRRSSLIFHLSRGISAAFTRGFSLAVSFEEYPRRSPTARMRSTNSVLTSEARGGSPVLGHTRGQD
jgi:hypothetical protein